MLFIFYKKRKTKFKSGYIWKGKIWISRKHILSIELPSKLEEDSYLSVTGGYLLCILGLCCFQCCTQELSSISSVLIQWIWTFDSFSLYRTNVLFSKSGSLEMKKCHYGYELNGLQGELTMITEKIMFLLTVCLQLLNFCCMSQRQAQQGKSCFRKADLN